MKAYLFSAGASMSQRGKTFGSDSMGLEGMVSEMRMWDACFQSIVGGETLEEAQERFDSWLKAAEEEGTQADVKKIVVAQFFDELLREPGRAAIDWPRVCQEAEARLEATPVDDFEQGYWVEVNDFVRPGRNAASVEALQRELPEEVRSGLNWSPERTFFFVVSILSGAPKRADKLETPALFEEAGDETGEDEGETVADDPLLSMPELAETAAAILVEARNSVVAAWLWRSFGAATELASNKIQIGPWRHAIGFEKG